jgi:cell division protein FtsW
MPEPIARPRNGSSRWINIGVSSFQPSELAKFAALCALAWWFARDRLEHEILRGFIYPLLIVGVLLALIVPEVDLGSTALIGGTTLVVMFVAGTRLRYLAPTVLLAIVVLGIAIWSMPERSGRFLAFLYPDKYPADSYQVMQGQIALGSGGVSGLGLGNSRQKLNYLPEAHTDFIFPIVGEELGLRFTLLVVLGYLVIIMSGAMISLHAPDRFGVLLGFGLVTIISLQAAVNIGVTTSVLPNKGLPLPFISYGGSNLVFCLLSVGVLLNMYKQSGQGSVEKAEVRLTARTRPRVVRI